MGVRTTSPQQYHSANQQQKKQQLHVATILPLLLLLFSLGRSRMLNGKHKATNLICWFVPTLKPANQNRETGFCCRYQNLVHFYSWQLSKHTASVAGSHWTPAPHVLTSLLSQRQTQGSEIVERSSTSSGGWNHPFVGAWSRLLVFESLPPISRGD